MAAIKLILIALFTCTTCFLTPVILAEVSALEVDDNINRSKRSVIEHTTRTGESCNGRQCGYFGDLYWMTCYYSTVHSQGCCTSPCVYSRSRNKYWCWLTERNRNIWDYCNPGVPYYKTNSDGSIQEYKPLLPEETSHHLTINRHVCDSDGCSTACDLGSSIPCGVMNCRNLEGTRKKCCAGKCQRHKSWLGKSYWWCKTSTVNDEWDYCTEGAPYYEESSDGEVTEHLSTQN